VKRNIKLLGVIFFLAGCDVTPPLFNGSNPVYKLTGEANDYDTGTGPKQQYSVNKQSLPSAKDGKTSAESIPHNHQSLSARLKASPSQNSLNLPEAKTEDKVSSDFISNSTGSFSLVVDHSAYVDLQTSVARYSYEIEIANSKRVFASHNQEFRFVVHPTDPNKINVFTGASHDPVANIANKSFFNSRYLSPNKVSLEKGVKYKLIFSLQTRAQSDGNAEILASSNTYWQ